MAYEYFNGQIPSEIRKQCKDTNCLFEDPEFPTIDSSVFKKKVLPGGQSFIWKRPSEIVDNPQMFVGGASRFDVNQGMLGDSWLLAAISSLTLEEKLLYRVVPPHQSFDKDYCGMFVFHFWQYGKWVEVVVDDRLPTYNNKMVFLHSESKNEFWSPLLEKAYAKLVGSYEALKGGQTIEAMEDLTGGLSQTVDLKKDPSGVFTIIQKSLRRGSLMGCSINAAPNEIQAKADHGLIKGHPYSVTGATSVNFRGNSVELIRVRNPWGNEREWDGAWGDKSSEWRGLSDSEKRKMGLTFEDDGEFWMSFSDFMRYFDKLEICTLGPDSVTGDISAKSWEGRQETGKWLKGFSAGGCRNFLNSFATNPQFVVTAEDTDDDTDDLCSFVIGLMQKNRRKMKRETGVPLLCIGYSIYKMTDDDLKGGRLDRDFFAYHQSSERSQNFINSREVCGRHSLAPGKYAIIPSTFEPGHQGDFLLRIYSEKPVSLSSNEKPTVIERRKFQRRTPDEDAAMDSSFKALFDKLAGVDKEIDAFELQQILSTATKKIMAGNEFSLEACRSLINFIDEDSNGKLGYAEFKTLWMLVKDQMKIFSEFDKDNSNAMDMYELRSALGKQGINLSQSTLDKVAVRYNNKKGKLSFDDFVQCLSRLMTMKGNFDKYKDPARGQATFSLDEFISCSVAL